MSAENSDHWQSRFKCEQILEVGCPRCGAKPHKWCDRNGDRLSKHGRALLKAGTPPSHQERMWTRQGHASTSYRGCLPSSGPDGGMSGCHEQASRGRGRPGGCTPCAAERKTREALNSPLFPVDFPCRHPRLFAVPSLPARYTADRVCAECGRLAAVEVVVQDPEMIGYSCDRGHKWLATADRAYLPGMEPESRKPAARKNGSPPVPVLVGKTGVGNVIPPDEDWPPWDV